MVNISSIKYNANFKKKGGMVYISHLDLMTLFRRAIRRACLPYVLRGGFTPRVKISMPKALKLGRESDNEEISFWLTMEKPAGEIEKTINVELPQGITIMGVRKDSERIWCDEHISR